MYKKTIFNKISQINFLVCLINKDKIINRSLKKQPFNKAWMSKEIKVWIRTHNNKIIKEHYFKYKKTNNNNLRKIIKFSVY
jgi:hypothetical protein